MTGHTVMLGRQQRQLFSASVEQQTFRRSDLPGHLKVLN
ncbi:hypothetical protein AtDm6_1597 [Acetobacter tropicalis]|uniref:Uncharacterized protein n=1 Tax=Acetobacter tropicalis TaxID=104102 RepID=A0A095B3T4_9PROT|nr:hypothetical protein AtDm6_1597 [Acetobacter tropicalis]